MALFAHDPVYRLSPMPGATIEIPIPVGMFIPQCLFQAGRKTAGDAPGCLIARRYGHHHLFDVILIVGARDDGSESSPSITAVYNRKNITADIDYCVSNFRPMHVCAVAARIMLTMPSFCEYGETSLLRQA